MYKQAGKFMSAHPDMHPVDIVGLIKPLTDWQRMELTKELECLEKAMAEKPKKLQIANILRAAVFKTVKLLVNREVLQMAAKSDKKVVKRIGVATIDVAFVEIRHRAARYSDNVNESGLRKEIAKVAHFVIYDGITRIRKKLK
jgi:hypothetical protein